MNTYLAVAVALFLLGDPATGQAPASSELAAWGSALDLDPRIPREIMRFEDEGPLGPIPAEAFARAAHAAVISAAADGVGVLLAGTCEPSVQVSIGESDSLIPEGVPAESEKAWDRFAGSLIRTEMVACLTTDMTDPEAVLGMYVSPEFRMVAESRIVDMWDDAEGACLETKGVMRLVAPTRICNRIQDFRAEGVAAQHSQVVFNQGEKPFEDVYFKESLKTFVRIPGGMALHYINYTRAGNLNRLARMVGPGQIRGSQEGNVKELQRRLEMREPPDF